MSAIEVTPITLEVIEGALESARREIELQVQRTARSQIIREITDLRAGVYSSTGQSVTSLSYAPTPSPIMKKFAGRINDGDIFLHNNVYSADGGISHLPDLCITVPVFESGQLVAFIMTFGHTEDIGGMEVSSMPMLATDIHQEGLIVPPVKLYEQGVRNEALWDVIGDNSRFPITLLSDLDGFINASRLGARRVTEIVSRYGLDVVNHVFDKLLARCSHDILHEAMPKIPDGEYEFEDYIEYDGVQPLETRRFLKLRMKMIKSPEKVVFDFTGTSDQSPGNVNWPGDEKYYAKYFGTLLKAFAPDLIVNDGIQDVVSCVMPDGCFLRPKYPAAVAHRSNALVRMLDVGMGVLAQATKGQVPGAAETLSYYILYGHDEKGRLFLFRDVTGAGSGARSFADGDDTVYLSPNSQNMPGEVAEQLFPLRFERIGLRSDSGGPGKFRGGMGYIRDVRILVDCNLLVISDRGQLNPWGVSGGKAGAKGVHILNPGTPEEIVLPAMLPAMPVKAGTLLHWLTPGGGGWGDALERDVEMVRLDVLRGLVSRKSADEDYGVIFDDGEELTLSEERTAARRTELGSSRPPLPMFDRGERYYELVDEGEIVPTMEDGLAVAT